MWGQHYYMSRNQHVKLIQTCFSTHTTNDEHMQTFRQNKLIHCIWSFGRLLTWSFGRLVTWPLGQLGGEGGLQRFRRRFASSPLRFAPLRFVAASLRGERGPSGVSGAVSDFDENPYRFFKKLVNSLQHIYVFNRNPPQRSDSDENPCRF